MEEHNIEEKQESSNIHNEDLKTVEAEIEEDNNCRIKASKLKSLQLFVALKLKKIEEKCFLFSMLEKFVGDSLETIRKSAFESSHFLKQINLKNVRKIGKGAFYKTSLRIIKNNYIQELK